MSAATTLQFLRTGRSTTGGTEDPRYVGQLRVREVRLARVPARERKKIGCEQKCYGLANKYAFQACIHKCYCLYYPEVCALLTQRP